MRATPGAADRLGHRLAPAAADLRPYQALVGAKGMEPAAVQALHDAFKKALEDPEYQKTLEKFDQEAYYLNSADYAALAKKTFEEEREAIKRLNLKM